MMRETIVIKDLAIGYPGKRSVKTVAEGITDTLYSGCLTCLLGENGAGKSTLLRTLAGFQPALGGSIEVMGKPLAGYTEKQLATIIGVVLTERNNLQNMTVAELVGMGRSPYTNFWGRFTPEDHEKVAAAMDLIGIRALGGRMVETLSDGERQKTMIAKALAQETPIIFLDEPTAFLDYPSKVEMLQLLRRLAAEMDKTIFLSTHDLELALQIADRLWVMAKRGAGSGTGAGSATGAGSEAGIGAAEPGDAAAKAAGGVIAGAGNRTGTAEPGDAAAKAAGGVIAGTPEELARNGTLEKYFSRKGVTFEHIAGHYRPIVTGD